MVRAVIYDFDSTLFHSHTREVGEPLYKEKMGSPWPHNGWWGRVETLMPPFVTDPVTEEYFIADTLANFRKDRADKDTSVYLMTGRPAKMARRIKEILGAVGCVFDDYYFRGMKGASQHGDTLDIKLHMIADQIIHPRLQTLEIWEDRPEHTSEFCSAAKRWLSKYKHLENVIVHDVPTGQKHRF